MDFRTLTIHGKDALALLEEHRAMFPETGEYPFLIGDDEELEMLEEMREDLERTAADYIRASRKIDAARWFANAAQEERDEFAADGEEFDEAELIGEWPADLDDRESNLYLPRNSNGKFRPKLIVGFAAIEEPWHLPAAMKYGSWNACPSPAEHCALHHYWQAKYGAQIVGMSHDVIECFVSNPPTTRKEAMKLAWEQYWYCGDIVSQGCGSISALAATLLNNKKWFFWWD
jgi:hypothetical protein